MIRANNSNREYIQLWRPPLAKGIELYSARLVAHTFGKHFHEEYTFGINDAGLGSFWCRGTKQVAGPKTLNLLAPGEVHTGAAALREGWTYRNMYVAPCVIKDLARQCDWQLRGLPGFHASLVADGEAWIVMDRLFRILDSRPSRLAADTALLGALRLVSERFADQRPPQRSSSANRTATAKARRYLEEHYRDEIHLDDLAEAAGVSSYYLIRCFREEFGLPPHAYQLQIRLQRAKADLRSDTSITDIAIKHGFFDQSHFCRHFKRAFGLTPGQYREGNIVQDE